MLTTHEADGIDKPHRVVGIGRQITVRSSLRRAVSALSILLIDSRCRGNVVRHPKTKKVKFVSDKGKNSCDKCLQYHGKIFDVDDPNKPKLPIHPNCRCKYEEIENSNKDMSNDVEQHRIVQTLKETYKLQEEDAKSLAGQVTKARNKNEKLREQKLFLIFNGRFSVW